MRTPNSAIHTWVLQVLCYGRPAYDAGYVGWGTPGLFSMLNSVADELLIHVYRGERPRDTRAFYDSTRLLGYGQVSLAAHFEPWSCDSVTAPPNGNVHAVAVPALLQASRHLVASHMLHILYRPRNGLVDALVPSSAPARYAVAVHLRRGDKLIDLRNSERIQLWNDSQVVPAVAKFVREQRAAGKPNARPTVLLASDDNAFAQEVETSLRQQLPEVDVVRPTNEHDAGIKSPFFSCSAGCIAPLQQLAAGFARADALMLSTKSNMGSFLLTYWAAANEDAVPAFIDMDGKTHKGQISRGKYFCGLGWGSRRGMCEANRTDVWVGPSAQHTTDGLANLAINQRPTGQRAGGASDDCDSALVGYDEQHDVMISLERILCERAGGYDALPGPTLRDGVAGLFSQLNVFADEMITRVYRGQGPSEGVGALLARTRLVGYGGGALSEHFVPDVQCSASGRGARELAAGQSRRKVCELGVQAAVDTLKASCRYTVVSALLRLVMRPKVAPPPTGAMTRQYDLAVHIRRGDRLWVERAVEKLSAWSAEAMLERMRAQLGRDASGSAPANGSAGKGKRVLLASDDNAYLAKLAALCREAGMAVDIVENRAEQFDASNRSIEAAKVCDGTCVTALLEMVTRFGRADGLMVSSKSNLGGFLISAWGALNPNPARGMAIVPGLVDLDGALRREAMPRRYFCELPWGSRHGLCFSAQSTCDVPRNAQSSLCRGKTAGGAKAGGAKAGGAKVGGAKVGGAKVGGAKAGGAQAHGSGRAGGKVGGGKAKTAGTPRRALRTRDE